MLRNLYEFGVGVVKSAKTFTKEERDADRFNCYKRNMIWSLVVKMENRGHSANDDIDQFYQSYGSRTSVTKIIKNL